MRRFTRAFAVGKERWRQLRRTGLFAAKHSPDKPIFSSDFGSKPTISRTGRSTLIPRGTHGYRETRDKPRTPLPQENKPESVSDRKRIWKINSYNFCRTPVCESGPRREAGESNPCAYYMNGFPKNTSSGNFSGIKVEVEP
jgi:hypothetical protein